MLPKTLIVLKKVWNESCCSLQKTQWVHMCSPPLSGARVLEKLMCLKYYNVLKSENRLTSELNVIIWKKGWSESCWEFNFLQKTQCVHMFISTTLHCGARVLGRLPYLRYYDVLKRENRLNWILNNFYLKFFSYNKYFWKC